MGTLSKVFRIICHKKEEKLIKEQIVIIFPLTLLWQRTADEHWSLCSFTNTLSRDRNFSSLFPFKLCLILISCSLRYSVCKWKLQNPNLSLLLRLGLCNLIGTLFREGNLSSLFYLKLCVVITFIQQILCSGLRTLAVYFFKLCSILIFCSLRYSVWKWNLICHYRWA